MALKLTLSVLCNALLSVSLYLMEKRTAFGKLSRKKRQCVIGLLFGLAAAFATEYGVDIGGAFVNVRDASPLCAGLIFGAPAGIIAGVIGGVYRWFAALWGAGTYTRLACSVSAVMAGLIAAALRTYMFDDRKPTWIYGFGIGAVCEVFHMLMIFFTNMGDARYAFTFVQKATLPMALANSLAVGAAVMAVSALGREKLSLKREQKQISQTFQFWLFICIVVAYTATSAFAYVLQTGMSKKVTETLIAVNLEDVRRDIAGAEPSQVISAAANRHIGSSGIILICDENGTVLTAGSRHTGENISSIGIVFDRASMAENTMFETVADGEPCYFAYVTEGEYLIVGLLPKSEALFMRDASIYVSIFIEVLIFAVLFVLIYFLIKRVVIDNIRKINRSLARITGGDLNVTVNVRTSEEFASLSDDINSTVSTLKRYIAEAAARIDRELEFARQIQRSALPYASSLKSAGGAFELDARMFAAKEVGGDFYDFYMLGGDKLAFLIADVSGKGIPAAMFMMRAKTTIRDLAESGLELSEVFAKANDKLCENNEAGMFVTAWMGVLDLKTGLLQFANAGHNPPLLRRADGVFEYLKVRSGLLLAGVEGAPYRKTELTLMPGDQIFLYTDGVTEATNQDERLYGEERLLRFLNEHRGASPGELCGLVKEDVDRFVGEALQFDDITMMGVRLKAVRGENLVALVPDKASLETIRDFTCELAERLGAGPGLSGKLHIVVDEIYSNIVNYSGATIAEVSWQLADGKVHLTFSDNGVPYDPLETAEPDITLSAEEREIGGLGVLMVKRFTETMEYHREDNRNILKIVIALPYENTGTGGF